MCFKENVHNTTPIPFSFARCVCAISDFIVFRVHAKYLVTLVEFLTQISPLSVILFITKPVWNHKKVCVHSNNIKNFGQSQINTHFAIVQFLFALSILNARNCIQFDAFILIVHTMRFSKSDRR